MDEETKRFARESVVLLRMLGGDLSDPTRVRLALAQAKTVRRETSTLVRELARERDALNDTL